MREHTFLHLYFRQQGGDAAGSEVFHVFAHGFPPSWTQHFVQLALAVKPDFKDQIKRRRRAVGQRAAFGNLDTGRAFGCDHQRCVRLEIIFIELLRVFRRAIQHRALKAAFVAARGGRGCADGGQGESWRDECGAAVHGGLLWVKVQFIDRLIEKFTE